MLINPQRRCPSPSPQTAILFLDSSSTRPAADLFADFHEFLRRRTIALDRQTIQVAGQANLKSELFQIHVDALQNAAAFACLHVELECRVAQNVFWNRREEISMDKTLGF